VFKLNAIAFPKMKCNHFCDTIPDHYQEVLESAICKTSVT